VFSIRYFILVVAKQKSKNIESAFVGQWWYGGCVLKRVDNYLTVLPSNEFAFTNYKHTNAFETELIKVLKIAQYFNAAIAEMIILLSLNLNGVRVNCSKCICSNLDCSTLFSKMSSARHKKCQLLDRQKYAVRVPHFVFEQLIKKLHLLKFSSR
jgi:hypothetical protein